ncbi:hypothetical protein, partial [Enterococcus faecium]|uniref:hypothetical protein n=1 Tax=Enterococcus faecium TaxID=1352 RepID=UPI003F43C731
MSAESDQTESTTTSPSVGTTVSADHAVELVDVGGGNIGSVMRCLERLNLPFRQAKEASQLTGKVPLI